MKNIIIDNGIKISIDQKKYFKTCAINISIFSGSCNETVETRGVAHLSEHLIFRNYNRCKKIHPCQSDGQTAMSNMSITFESLPSDIISAIHRSYEVIKKLYETTKKDVQIEKKIINIELSSMKDDSSSYCQNEFFKMFFKDMLINCSIDDEIKSNSNLKYHQVMQFINDNFDPCNITIGIVGSFDIDIIQNEVIQTFSQLQSTKQNPAIPYEFSMQCGKSRIINCENHSSSHFAIGAPIQITEYDDSTHIEILSNILCGDFGTKLFKKIREKYGWSYYLTCVAYGIYGSCSSLSFFGDTTSKNIQNVADVIKSNLQNIKTYRPKIMEFENAKKTVEYNYIINSIDPCYIAKQNANGIYDNTAGSWKNELMSIKKCTYKDMLDFISNIETTETNEMYIIGNR